MASLFTTLSLRTIALAPRRAVGALFQPLVARAAPMGVTSSTTTGSVAVAVQQQTRGMKVQSAIKKRCEHCKIVRRKGGKRHNGYLYVICKSNPRHKQRQG